MVLLTCIVGEARTLSNPCVHLSLRGNVLDVLEAGVSSGVSVALLVKHRLRQGSHQHDSSNVSRAALSTIRPDTLRVVTPHSYDERVGMCPDEPCVQSPEGPLTYNSAVKYRLHMSLLTRCANVSDCVQPFLGQLASWQSCLGVAETMESAGRAIDAILTLRADLVWHGRFPLGSLSMFDTPYLQSRTMTPLSREDSLRVTKCTLAPKCSFVPHQIGDWVFSVPRALAPAALGAAREYCAACRRPVGKAFSVPSRMEDFLTARIAQGVIDLSRKSGKALPMPLLHTMPAVVLRGETDEEKRQLRSCYLASSMRGTSGAQPAALNGNAATAVPTKLGAKLDAKHGKNLTKMVMGRQCAQRLKEACWTNPVTAADYATRLSAEQLGLGPST